MFWAGLVLIIRWYYFVCIAVGICHAWHIPISVYTEEYLLMISSKPARNTQRLIIEINWQWIMHPVSSYCMVLNVVTCEYFLWQHCVCLSVCHTYFHSSGVMSVSCCSTSGHRAFTKLLHHMVCKLLPWSLSKSFPLLQLPLHCSPSAHSHSAFHFYMLPFEQPQICIVLQGQPLITPFTKCGNVLFLLTAWMNSPVCLVTYALTFKYSEIV